MGVARVAGLAVPDIGINAGGTVLKSEEFNGTLKKFEITSVIRETFSILVSSSTLT